MSRHRFITAIILMVVIVTTYAVIIITMIITIIVVMTSILRPITVICIALSIIIAIGTIALIAVTIMVSSGMPLSFASERMHGRILASLFEEGSLLLRDVILVCAWMMWFRMFLEYERDSGLGMDALVTICSWNPNIIMGWAWMHW